MKPSELIDKNIKELNDWRGEIMAKLRVLIHEADPEIVEEWKWEVPVFVHTKMVCALGSFKDHVKANFFKGASLDDKDKLFNAGFDAKTSRSIDIFEGDKINETAFKDLIRQAVKFNETK